MESFWWSHKAGGEKNWSSDAAKEKWSNNGFLSGRTIWVYALRLRKKQKQTEAQLQMNSFNNWSKVIFPTLTFQKQK